jgi:hypothetical protein
VEILDSVISDSEEGVFEDSGLTQKEDLVEERESMFGRRVLDVLVSLDLVEGLIEGRPRVARHSQTI